MKEIKTTEAVGQVLCHDVTRIIKGVTKDAAFRKEIGRASCRERV